MATYVLIHGAGSDSWYWHLVVPELQARGHTTVAVDLPSDDDSAGWDEYADAVVDAVGDRPDLVVVGQSLAGFTAPMVCERLPARLMILVAGMIPRPGETGGEWWANTGHEEAMRARAMSDGYGPVSYEDAEVLFVHDVPPDLAAESLHHVRDQSGTPFGQPWPLAAWPDVPTRLLTCREDRFFPDDFMRQVALDRLGLVPDEMAGGHLPALARPADLAERLHRYLDG